MPWFIGNDQFIDVTGLKDPVTDDFLNDATVTVTLKDSAGAEVQGQSWPVTLEYVDGTDGNYQGLLEDGRVMVDGQRYWAELSVEGSFDLVGFWRWSDVARYRQPGE